MTDTTETTPQAELELEQTRRALALIAAREALTGTASVFGSKENNRTAADLMEVAEYIVSGRPTPKPDTVSILADWPLDVCGVRLEAVHNPDEEPRECREDCMCKFGWRHLEDVLRDNKAEAAKRGRRKGNR